MSIMDKLKKNSKVKATEILADSKFFNDKDMISTDTPMINIALSGEVDGGLAPGLTVLAGPSKHFKTSFALIMASAYLKKYKDAVLLFYDSEFGSPQQYFEQFEIDTTRVLHTPITNVEELKFDIVGQLEGLSREDKVIIVIDSIGNLASKKEMEDAINEKSVADMSRAKALKGLFRMCTPYLNMKNIPLVAVNHTYQEIGLFPKAIVSGGTGIYYSADNIWILGRRQNKKGTDVVGYDFVINVAKPSNGWYCRVNQETGELLEPKVREAQTLEEEFWKPIFADTNFKDYLTDVYKIGGNATIDFEEIT